MNITVTIDQVMALVAFPLLVLMVINVELLVGKVVIGLLARVPAEVVVIVVEEAIVTATVVIVVIVIVIVVAVAVASIHYLHHLPLLYPISYSPSTHHILHLSANHSQTHPVSPHLFFTLSFLVVSHSPV